MTPRGGTMGDVHRLPSTDDAEREASAWIARMNADDVTADDRTRFEAWLRAQSCNAKAYAELSATWQELVKSGPLVRAVYFGQVMNAASTPPWPPVSGRWFSASPGIYTSNRKRPAFKQRSVSRPRWHCPTVLRSTSIPTAGYGSTTASAGASFVSNAARLSSK